MMGEMEKKALLRLARRAVAAQFGETPPPDGFPPAVAGARQGLFVTLYKKGELRGCVGQVHPDKNILETVTEAAREAAFGDPRFLPLQADEFADTVFELSLLSPLTRVRSPAEIRPGTDGV